MKTWPMNAPGSGQNAPVTPDGPSVPSMIALVAIVVALVILVFFALGYLLGRAFL